MSEEQRTIIELTMKLARVLVRVTEYEAMPMLEDDEVRAKESESLRLRDEVANLSNELKRISNNFNSKAAALSLRKIGGSHE